MSQRAFALAGLAAPILFWGVLLLLAALRPDYTNLGNQVSEIGAIGVPYGQIGQGTFALHGALLVIFAIGIVRDIWKSPVGVGPVLMLLIGTASLAAGIFPLYPARPEAFTNIAHGLFILPGTFAAFTAPFFVARRMRGDDRWQKSYYYCALVTGGLLVLFFLLSLVISSTDLDPSWSFTIQQLMGRAHHAVLNIWVFAVSIHLFHLASSGDSPPER